MMNLPTPTPVHTPFAVSNPLASDPDAFDRKVILPQRAAELSSQADDLRTALEAPALGLSERATLKRQLAALRRRIDAMDLPPADLPADARSAG